MLGLAIAFAISALVNLAFLISPRTRETLLSSGRWLIKKVQTFCANPNPNTNLTFPDPPRNEEAAAASGQPPKPPLPPPTPAIVWPTVRASAPPPPPPRNLYYGAKGIFETGKSQKKLMRTFERQRFGSKSV